MYGSMGVFDSQRLADGGTSKAQELGQSRYFRMGAAVALGEMIRGGIVADSREMREQIREYLESFGIRGMDDIEALGIGSVYRYDFEHIYC